MMKNFYDMAEEGCLLAVSVTGNEDLVDFNKFRSSFNSQEKSKMAMRKTRSSSYLSPRLSELGKATGW